jgi:hypothetical protein
MTGLTQGVLYLDGVYVVVLALFNVAFAYLSFRGAIDRGELDVISTEFERCLAKSSLAYWLIRGDLQFLITNQPTWSGWWTLRASARLTC